MDIVLNRKSTAIPPSLGVIVPCYNEEAVLPETSSRLKALIASMRAENLISDSSAIFFVDDGSRDRTWELISGLTADSSYVCGIKMSRNRGHQNALFCGLMTAPGDILISVDADLQDDLDVIPEMVRKYISGADVVYGVRRERYSDTWFKKFSAEGYYKVLAILGVDVVFNHADYRLLSRRAVTSLSEYSEVNFFLRGLVPLIGYPSAIVEYDRAERFSGVTKYPLRKMLSFAWQGITSFSIKPLRIITVIGLLVSAASLSMAIWGLSISVFTDRALPGWASTVVPLYFLGGVQLLSLGIIGEYIGKIFIETKRRPRFHVEETRGAAIFAHDKRDNANI